MNAEQLVHELVDGGDGDGSLWGMRTRLYDAVRSLSDSGQWDTMLEVAHESAKLLAPEAFGPTIDDEAARSTFEDALDATFTEAVERVEALAGTTPVKAVYSEYIEGWQASGMVGVTGIFLCDQDASDREDWPAFFVEQVPGPDWEPVVRGWLTAEVGGSATVWFQLAHLTLVASFGRAWHLRPRGIPFFFAEHDFEPIALAR